MYFYGASWVFGFLHTFYCEIHEHSQNDCWPHHHHAVIQDPWKWKKRPKTLSQLINTQIINSIWREFAHWKETGAGNYNQCLDFYIWQWQQSFCHLFLKGWKVIFWGRGQHFPLFNLNYLSCSSAAATCLEGKQ